MGTVPVLKPREVAALLGKLGFVEVRQRGSHQQFRHPDGRGTTIPFHQGRDISPTLLRQISKDIGLSVEESSLADEPAAEPCVAAIGADARSSLLGDKAGPIRQETGSS